MDLQLSGKRAFISGSTAGIGLAIAHALAKEGARVMLNGRTQARVSEAVRQVKERSGPLSSGINSAALRVDGGVVRAVG